MGTAQEAGRLRIGVPIDAPPIGSVGGNAPIPSRPDASSGPLRGLATDLGRLVADALHVRAEFVALPAEAMFERLDRGALELAFPDVPLTERGLRTYSFTNPYALVHQRLLVAPGSAVTAVEDLAGERVCAYLDPVTGADLSALGTRVEVVAGEDLAACADLFRRGRVAAITAHDIFLQFLRGKVDGVIVGDELATAGYGAAVATGASSFAAIVEEVLADAEADGTWERIYERWVGAEPEAPPDLTAEEAAALFPIGAG